jgi:hypothetical protein
MGYRRNLKVESLKEIIDCFLGGLARKSWPFSARESIVSIQRYCITSLTAALVDFPHSISARFLSSICDSNLALWIRESALIVHALEMIATISAIPALFSTLKPSEMQRLFKICCQYLDSSKVRACAFFFHFLSYSSIFFLSSLQNEIHLLVNAYQSMVLLFSCSPFKDRPQHFQFIAQQLLPIIQGANEQVTSSSSSATTPPSLVPALVVESSSSLLAQAHLDRLAALTYVPPSSNVQHHRTPSDGSDNIASNDVEAPPSAKHSSLVAVSCNIWNPPPGGDADSLFLNATVRDTTPTFFTQGNSIISIQIGTRGWSKIVVRRPSGSRSWFMQLQQSQTIDASTVNESQSHIITTIER